MKPITIRELHHQTGKSVRKAAKFGEFHIGETRKPSLKSYRKPRHLNYPILLGKTQTGVFAE